MMKDKNRNYTIEKNILIEKRYNEKEDVQRRIKALRERMGMTQQEFSDYFEVSKRAVEEWERGGRKVPMYLLKLMEYKANNEGFNN